MANQQQQKNPDFSYVYMGEYPHCFAACLGQVESFRLVLSRGVDPNATDFNGNNVLHIMVIKDKIVSKQVLNDFFSFFNFASMLL